MAHVKIKKPDYVKKYDTTSRCLYNIITISICYNNICYI